MKQLDAEVILREKIKDNSTHQDYDKVVKYAKLMKRLVTGHNIELELLQFVRRETLPDFTQRVQLSHIITPAICSAIMSPAYKIPKVKPTVDRIDFESDSTKTGDSILLDLKAKTEKLESAVDAYNGGAGVCGFQETRFFPMSYIDPNAFVLTLFGKFDSRFETAKPYPVIASSEEAIWYDITDNNLYWLIVRNNITYQEKFNLDQTTISTRTVEGKVYQQYFDNGVVEYSQVDASDYGNLPDMTEINLGAGVVFFKVDSTRVFKVSYYNAKTGGKIQAKRIGYKLDEATDGRTCVSPLHPALPYLMKSIKLCSELDISVTLHTFLQKIAYQPKCKGESNTIGCDNGYAPNGTICTVCKGVGYVVHESSQDAIYLSLPRNKDDAFDLTKLIHYQDIPIDILKFLKEHLQDVKDDAISAVYNGEALIEQSINKTATAKTYDMQNVYDALYPLAQQDAAFRIFQIELIAGMNDLKGVIVEYSYPKDFKMRGLEELMDLLEKANKSGAPMAIRSDISNDIAAMMFQDRPNDLKKLQVKQQFNPFDGKNVEEINIILVNDLCTKEHKIMWSESATIFAELEEESMQQTVTNANAIWFYDLPYKDQKTAIQKKVAEIVTQIEADQPVATQFDATGVPVGAAPAPVAPAGGQGGAAL